ncbi:helix-turn-helix transcriptional regulator [Paracraurococcus lichenis]|uniref:LuxR C-terminal-related transcriptional regulator n=1 Tax=Paracraurococcus lichenis TaxID=3064888 RepID=A0ABT9E3X7_9PROT|nr:LuxR C-terminal-related transcriptional regulator [Paracraurococcus sp. LOR1-02]MDO9710871.1 LuxR C-terminal-related transcriptional regulator [Paracraurococcus sp. LOR1-02]
MAALADIPLKPAPAAAAPRGAPARAPVAVALRRPDAELAARLGDLAGVRLVADPGAADVIVAEAPEREGPPVLVLAEGAAAVAALRAGARSVLPPEAPAAQLEAALAATARGLSVLAPATVTALAGREAAPPETGLTRREREVLDLLAAGASNKVIARRLGLSFHTAKAHVASVLQKLGASSRADAVARGARAGLVLL